MAGRLAKTIGAGICAASMGGCAIVSDLGATGLAENIESNAATLNEAHTRAMGAIIAVNVLRARDRWPTNYTTLSGIKSNPTLALNGSASLAPLGFGNPADPLSNSALSLSRNETSNAEYSVNPFANNEKTQSLLKPIKPETMLDYWNAGWPRATLMWMFIDAVKYKDAGAYVFINGDDFADQTSPSATDARRFTTLIEDADSGRIAFGQLDFAGQDERSCAPYDPAYVRESLGDSAAAGETLSGSIAAIEKLTGKRLVLARDNRAVRGANEPALATDRLQRQFMLCDPALPRWGFFDVATGDEVAEIRTRSFDDMIYFLGETLRVSEGRSEASIGGVVLFKTYQNRAGLSFAVRVEHAGGVYFIAPQSPQKLDGDLDDQTGNVLGLLNQLFLFAQSDEFLRAPDARIR